TVRPLASFHDTGCSVAGGGPENCACAGARKKRLADEARRRNERRSCFIEWVILETSLMFSFFRKKAPAPPPAVEPAATPAVAPAVAPVPAPPEPAPPAPPAAGGLIGSALV